MVKVRFGLLFALHTSDQTNSRLANKFYLKWKGFCLKNIIIFPDNPHLGPSHRYLFSIEFQCICIIYISFFFPFRNMKMFRHAFHALEKEIKLKSIRKTNLETQNLNRKPIVWKEKMWKQWNWLKIDEFDTIDEIRRNVGMKFNIIFWLVLLSLQPRILHSNSTT